MGDVRFGHALARVTSARDRAGTIRTLPTDDLIKALAAASPERDPVLVNVLATELENRARRSTVAAEHLPAALVFLDDEGRITSANRNAELLVGAALHTGTPAADALDLRDPSDARVQPWVRALAGASEERNDLDLVTLDGRRIPVALGAGPVRIDGHTVGVVLAMSDHTQTRLARDDLEFHKRLLDAVGEALMATRPDGTIVYWGSAAERVYGWSASEVLGRNIVDVTPSRASRLQSEAIMAQLGRGEEWAGTFPVRRRDGSEFVADVTNAPVLDAAGRLVAIIGVSRPSLTAGTARSDPAGR